ncbi:MAG: hypothetical protein GY765_02860 [bacterium]|nr:hypothetical protein [bacterium]
MNSFIELTNNEGFYVNQARIYHVIGIEFLDAAVDLSLIDITKYKREALTLAGFTLDFTARL